MKLIKVVFSHKPKSDSYNEECVMAYMYFENNNGVMPLSISMTANAAYHFPHKCGNVEIEYKN